MKYDYDSQDVINVGKLVIYKNALIYKNSVIQISNICSAWVTDQSYEIHRKMSGWIKMMGLLGAGCVLFGLLKPDTIAIAIGALFVTGFIIGLIKHQPITPISKFALGIERASGRIMFISGPDQQFIQKAAQHLMETISQSNNASEKVTMNFDNKSIHVDTITNSTVVGGNVHNSLVESVYHE